MKKLFTLLTACLVWAGVSAQTAEPQKAEAPKSVPIGVYVAEDAQIVPPMAAQTMKNKLMQIVTTNGMGADNQAQFFITSLVNINDKQVIPGAPAKILLEAEVVFYIVDSYTNKVFDTASVTGRGIGTNEEKAYTAVLRAVQPRNAEIAAFVRRANDKIIEYYESQIGNIVEMSQALARSGAYEEALYALAVVPDICEGYDKISAQGVDVYQKMIDEESFKAYSKAKNVWGSGHTYEAAAEAGNYLAEVSPYATCYADAETLAAEIKKFVTDEHAYERKKEEEQLARERKLEDDQIAWSRKMEEAKMKAEEDKELRAHELANKRADLQHEEFKMAHGIYEQAATEVAEAVSESANAVADSWREAGLAYAEKAEKGGYSMDWMSDSLKAAIGI